jgi:hypothetical protein
VARNKGAGEPSLINSHIIPAFYLIPDLYLEQFSTRSTQGKDKPGRVWVYERGREPDDQATSGSAAKRGGFILRDPFLQTCSHNV